MEMLLMSAKSWNWMKTSILISILTNALLFFYCKLLGSFICYVPKISNLLKYFAPLGIPQIESVYLIMGFFILSYLYVPRLQQSQKNIS
jgi:hypothetical protein